MTTETYGRRGELDSRQVTSAIKMLIAHESLCLPANVEIEAVGSWGCRYFIHDDPPRKIETGADPQGRAR